MLICCAVFSLNILSFFLNILSQEDKPVYYLWLEACTVACNNAPPHTLKTLFERALVAGNECFFFARLLSLGKFCWWRFHHSRGSVSGSTSGVNKEVVSSVSIFTASYWWGADTGAFFLKKAAKVIFFLGEGCASSWRTCTAGPGCCGVL